MEIEANILMGNMKSTCHFIYFPEGTYEKGNIISFLLYDLKNIYKYIHCPVAQCMYITYAFPILYITFG